MLHTVILIIMSILAIINMILIYNATHPFYDVETPQHNAMDKYNDVNKRLEALEKRFDYHIQSTDELKPKA